VPSKDSIETLTSSKPHKDVFAKILNAAKQKYWL